MPRFLTVAVLAGLLLAAAGQAQSAGGAETEAIQFLQQLVRLDTSNPPGNEIQAAQYIKSVFDKEGIPSEIIESAPGRANLVARLKGNGSKRPVLLMAHLDVVKVDRSKWSIDPFAATMKDGYLYGRGSSDDKSMVAANMEVLLQLKRERVKLDRDVIFLSEAGEEGSPQFGISYMVKNQWDKIACEFALNEGGSTLMKNGQVAYVAVGTTEKNPRVIRLIAHGSSGHGSVPRLDNPIAHLGRALGKLLDWQPPMKLNETTRAFFANIDKISDDPQLRQAAAHLDSAQSQQFLARKYPGYYSMLRTSVVPTIVQGGFQRNVIPAEAEATLDTRAVPDENFDELLQQLRKLIDDPAVEVVLNPAYRTISPPSKLDSEMYKALVVAQQKLYPKTFTIPQMGTGATDSSELRAKGVQAYGVHSPQTAADQATVHGNDERVQVEGVNEFVRYLRIAVEQVAATHAAVELNQGPAGYASSLEDVLAAMDAAAAKFSSAQANFSSEQYEAVVKERNTQAGVLYIRRAGDRVDMAADFNQPSDQRKYVLFTNGKVQLYQPKINQVTVYDAGKNKEALQSFLILGFGSRGHDLEKQFEIKYSGTENLQGIKTAKLELTPRAERVRSMFDRIVLWVDPARGVATQQQFFEPSGNYRLVKYATITNNGKLPHDAFKLKTKGIPTIVTNP